MLVGLLSGRGFKEKLIENNPKENTQTENKTTEPAKPTQTQVEEVPGTELSTFMVNYTDAKSKVWDAMSKKFEEENLAFTTGSLGFAFADLAVPDILFNE